MVELESNVDIFNRICLHLFSKLYDSFPVPIPIDADRLGVEAISEDLIKERAFDVMGIANETLDFLNKEGFLTQGESVSAGKYSNVRLTIKGLAILGVPVSLDEKEKEKTLIDRIKNILGKGAGTTATTGIQTVVSEIFKLAIN